MKTTLEDIRALIVSKMQGLTRGTGADLLFGEVFDYGQGKFEKYPVAVVLPTGGSSGQEIDTHRNERTFSFMVSLYQEQSRAGATKQEANDIMTEAVDKVIIAFDQDKTLGGEIQRVKVVKMTFDFKVSAGTYIFATFQVDCDVIVSNY